MPDVKAHEINWLLWIGLAACSGGTRQVPTPIAAAPDAGVPVAVAADAAPPAPQRIAGGTITMTIAPAPAYVELADHAQLVNCDLVVDNGTGVAWELAELTLTARDRAGAMVWKKFLGGGGVSPSILTVPNRALPPGQTLIMNPLFDLPGDLELGRLDFELTYTLGDEQLVARASVEPVVYRNHAKLELPLRGRVLVWDGHDFLSHHRRWDYVFQPIRDFGFTSNPARYSYDLVLVDADGAMHGGDAANDAGYVGWGQPVYATAAGKVVTVVDTMPDDHQFDIGGLKDDLMVMYGNRIVIDHGHGEHSVFAHLKQGSAKVKVGDTVKAGAELAAIGASGSAMFPHLHYQLQTSADGHAEGLPSYFIGVGQIDSGDLVTYPAPKQPKKK
jgi:hypothetical protein